MRQQLFIVIVSVVTLICPVISADQTLYNHYTIYGVQCSKPCAQQGKTYYWCHNEVNWAGWDYCSPAENTDIYGNPCQKDHPCGKYGEDFYWCKNGWLGSWEKCAPVEPKSTIYNTKSLSVCIDDCIYDDYYSWCETESSWDYCGVIKPGECSFFDTQRRKRRSTNDNNNRIGFCTRVDRGNNRVITFYATPNSRSIAEVTNRNRVLEIRQLLERWDNGYLAGDQARSEVMLSTHYRIDIQGMQNIDNQRYFNLQIQENIHRNNRESTTVSQILVPQHYVRLGVIPERYIRRAFEESQLRRARVFLKIEPWNNMRNIGQK